jgi:hypothetical protein
MVRYAVSVAIWIMTWGQAAVSQDAAHAEAQASETLMRAVGKMHECPSPYHTDKHSFDKNRNEILDEDTKEKDELTNRMSIPILFKPGRFRLKALPSSWMPDGSPAEVIGFSPLPEAEERKAGPGEDQDVNRTFNRMSGAVFLDPETGSIMRVYADLVGEVAYTRWWMLGYHPVRMKAIHFTYDQALRHGRWEEALFSATLDYWRRDRWDKEKRDRHDTYVVTFPCGT